MPSKQKREDTGKCFRLVLLSLQLTQCFMNNATKFRAIQDAKTNAIKSVSLVFKCAKHTTGQHNIHWTVGIMTKPLTLI